MRALKSLVQLHYNKSVKDSVEEREGALILQVHAKLKETRRTFAFVIVDNWISERGV